MKHFKIISLFSILLLLPSLVSQADNRKGDLVLWYQNPAQAWEDALAIGNGRLGAMVFGGVETEHLQLNENTLYSGEPSLTYKNVRITPESFNEVLALMKAGKYAEAQKIICQYWLGRQHQSYQPLGDLYIKNNKSGAVSGYKRQLDLTNAVTTTVFNQDGIHYEREVFASHPDNVIVIHLKSSRADGIDVSLQLNSPHPTAKSFGKEQCLFMHGQAPGLVEPRTLEQLEKWGDQYKHPELFDANGKRKTNKCVLYGNEIDGKGTFFEAQIKPVFPKGGLCEIKDSVMHVYKTGEVYFILSMATSFNGWQKSPSREGVDASAKAAGFINQALTYNYSQLKTRHTADYKKLFDRVSLQLPSTAAQKALPTDERIDRFSKAGDGSLAAMLFQFGRYLMISGSREGGQPLNLQGIWNRQVTPPWESAYTININIEMNYWPAEITNLSECTDPLFNMIKELAVSGTETAKTMYNRRGWVAHHNTSIWRESIPNDYVPSASFWPMSEGWLCSSLWEHYLFTGDKKFLKDYAYPLMKGAAEFLSDWLVEDNKGRLVTPAGLSPENTFVYNDSIRASLSMGPTMDMSIIRELFTRVIATEEMFNIDQAFCNELKAKLPRLLPYQIGAKGQLQEWMEDFKENEPQHRHMSHLYGFFPGDQITLDKTPELFQAVRKTLELRGDISTGWSLGWKLNCWARQLDGNHAYRIVSNLFNPVNFGNNGHKGGGLYRNMFDAHPPFQIDGNFGYTAGVTEMLLQSHDGIVRLLPALPDAWPQGHVSGICARGNYEISMDWDKGHLTKAVILSKKGGTISLRSIVPLQGKNLKETDHGKYYDYTIDTVEGQTYQLKAK